MGFWSSLGVQAGMLALGGVWTYLKTRDWWGKRKEERSGEALLALEAGVDATYETYVRAIKEASEDGKLTKEERKRARQLAREAAVQFGANQGVDVLTTLGEDYVNLWINKLVKRLKES